MSVRSRFHKPHFSSTNIALHTTAAAGRTTIRFPKSAVIKKRVPGPRAAPKQMSTSISGARRFVRGIACSFSKTTNCTGNRSTRLTWVIDDNGRVEIRTGYLLSTRDKINEWAEAHVNRICCCCWRNQWTQWLDQKKFPDLELKFCFPRNWLVTLLP